MVFGWAVEQGVSSNSVIYVKDGCTVGIGTGEQDGLGVAELAVVKATQNTVTGSVLKGSGPRTTSKKILPSALSATRRRRRSKRV